jgi:hypothetical protein
MSPTITLPDGPLTFSGGAEVQNGQFTSRRAYAAVPVVADQRADNGPGRPAVLDWETTLQLRRRIWAHGFGVAEAMDTAQRGMGLDYPTTRELIRRTAAQRQGDLVAGVATDQLPAGPASLDDIRKAYAEQLADVQTAGAVPVLMCSRHLAATARDADDYLAVYAELLEQADRPVILHWLGDAFDPALTGYWGSTDLTAAAGTVLDLIAAHPDRIEGVKISLLDAGREIDLRRRLPDGVRMYTGDDFHYPELIKGDEQGFSHALLGVLAVIAPPAAAALRALDAGDLAGYDRLLAPTVPLARHLFATPTYYYKTGITFLNWIAGHQDHFTMVGGLQSGRPPLHLARLLRLAEPAGILPDAGLATHRARAWLETAGLAA